MSKQTTTVFISSTAEDLGPYREAARLAVEKAGLRPVHFETWPAGAEPALADCLRRVEAADLVVAIVAHRYGWVPAGPPEDEAKSITWATW